MTYMENLSKHFNIQHRESGAWVTVEENVGIGGYLEYLKRCKGDSNYRVVDGQGDVVRSPSQVLNECNN